MEIWLQIMEGASITLVGSCCADSQVAMDC